VYSSDEQDNTKSALVFQREVINNIIPFVRPDIIHCHDWMTGLIPAYARRLGIPSLFTLHNIHTDKLLLEAIEARASDIHIEPFEKEVKIKYRIDGLLSEKSSSPKKLQAAIISRIKIMGNMNIAERFVPQDGHIEFMGKNGKVDIRVSTVPTVFGESIVMRILDRSAALISLEKLGMNPTTLTGFNHCLNKAHGVVLVTGPTGSGKTTTLYAALQEINKPLCLDRCALNLAW
jgi:type II secretory ATPase GspE/PulE/Tfp pilus assembly ATPase PilB-like protein